MEEGSIRRADALRDMEMREDKYGRRVLYSIEFYKKDGELVYFSHAYTAGLRVNMKTARVRGVQQCDAAGNKVGHIYTVSIDNLRRYNGKIVKL